MTVYEDCELCLGVGNAWDYVPDAPSKKPCPLCKMREKLEKLEAELHTAQDDLAFLSALRQAGVDNWEGYEQAQEIYQEMQEDD